MATVNVGLIGCGGRLRGVVKHLRDASSEVNIAALFDVNPDSITAAKEAYNPNATVYDSPEALAADESLDWVMVGSWNCFHAEHVIAAFNAGKHVFCEKPLGLSVDECLAIYRAWKESGKQFVIGFTLRFSPHYRKVKELIDAGTIGEVISMEFNETLDPDHGGYIHADWRRKTEWAGSHLLEKCCHDIDLVNWMLESRVSRAAAFGGNDFFTPANASQAQRLGDNNGKPAFESWSHVRHAVKGNIKNPFNDDKDILDNQVAIMEYESGVKATFHTNCMSAIPERRMYINGTEGTLRADVIAGTIEYRRYGYGEGHDLQTVDANASGGHGGGDSILGQELADAMHNGTSPSASLEAGLMSAVSAFGIDKAQSTQAVYDLAPLWEQVDATIAQYQAVAAK